MGSDLFDAMRAAGGMAPHLESARISTQRGTEPEGAPAPAPEPRPATTLLGGSVSGVSANVDIRGKGFDAATTAHAPAAAVPAASSMATAGSRTLSGSSSGSQASTNQGLTHGWAKPQSSYDKDYPDGGEKGRFKTRGPHHDQSVRVACDYTVAARDPISGQQVNVVFQRVAQDRDLGLGSSLVTFGGYNTKRDTNSKVLACEGIDYKMRQNVSRNGDMSTISEPSGSHAFDASKIPDLQARLKQFEATGATGNSAPFDARENDKGRAAK